MSTISTRYNTPLDILSAPKRLPSSEGDQGTLTAEQKKAKIDKARQAAEGLVSTSFIKPILAQARESNNAPPPFGPTQAEKQFQSLLDNQLSDELVHAAQFPIVERMVKQFTAHLEQPEQTQQIDLSA